MFNKEKTKSKIIMIKKVGENKLWETRVLRFFFLYLIVFSLNSL